MTETTVQIRPVERELTTGYFSSFFEAIEKMPKISPDEILIAARRQGIVDWAISGMAVTKARGLLFGINPAIGQAEIFSKKIQELAEAEASKIGRQGISKNLQKLSDLGFLLQTKGENDNNYKKQLELLMAESPYSFINYFFDSFKWVWGFKKEDPFSEVERKSGGGRLGDSQDYNW